MATSSASARSSSTGRCGGAITGRLLQQRGGPSSVLKNASGNADAAGRGRQLGGVGRQRDEARAAPAATSALHRVEDRDVLGLDAHDAGGHRAGVLVGERADVGDVGRRRACLELDREVDDRPGAGERRLGVVHHRRAAPGRASVLRLAAEPGRRGVERLARGPCAGHASSSRTPSRLRSPPRRR